MRRDGMRPVAQDSPTLVLFTRVPVPGHAKTRLLPALSPQGCAALQRALALDAAERLAAAGWPLTVRYSDEAPGSELEAGFLAELKAAARGAATYRAQPQVGADLGARMHAALTDELDRGAPACLLMGSDLPLVTTELVRQAWRAFDPRADVLLGPSDDGGYWFVGLRSACPELFSGKRYGAGDVLGEALATCRAASRTPALGPVARDVDTPDDLAWLRRLAAEGDPRVGRRTREAVEGV